MSSDLKLKSLLIYVRDITIESAKKSPKNTGLAGNKSGPVKIYAQNYLQAPAE